MKMQNIHSLEIFQKGLSNFKPLPPKISYYDDFEDVDRQINNTSEHIWFIMVDGSKKHIDFSTFPQLLQIFLKHWVYYNLQKFCPAHATNQFSALKMIEDHKLIALITSSPKQIKTLWIQLVRETSRFELSSLKSILHFIANQNLFLWSVEWKDFLSTLPLHFQDKYASVREGSIFLTLDEETKLIIYFDNLVEQLRLGGVSEQNLKAATLLLCSYQFGLRPKQIAMLEYRDVRIWKPDENDLPSVHLTFMMIKQRCSNKKKFPMTRKVKREWSPLFVELYSRATSKGKSGADRIFDVESAYEVSQIIADTTEIILKNRRTATELRHAAAQRLVDAGANQEELAEFMGHSDSDTGLVYFQSSQSQAERINQAMAISQIYNQVIKIAHDKFISLDELAVLKSDQQIGGIPHGIPIAGIGGCTKGQSLCQFNPVLSCYGCHKFMPLNNLQVHQSVLEELRNVVKLFSESGRGDDSSPAYMQLKRTLASIQAVMKEIEGETSNE